MSRVNYNGVAQPNTDGARLVGQGGSLLVNSIGALGDTFARRAKNQQEQEALELKLKQDEADAYVMRNIAAQKDKAGLDATFENMANDPMALSATAKAFIDAEGIRTGRANQAQTYANTGLIGAQTRGVDARTAGTLLSNSISRSNHNYALAERQARDDAFKAQYGGKGYLQVTAENQAMNYAPEVFNAGIARDNAELSSQWENLHANPPRNKDGSIDQQAFDQAKTSLLQNVPATRQADFAKINSINNMSDFVPSQDSQLASLGRPVESTEGGLLSSTVAPIPTSDVDQNGVENTVTGYQYTGNQGATNTQEVPQNDQPIEPVRDAPQPTAETSQNLLASTQDTKNSHINTLKDIYQKGQTQTLTGEDRERAKQAYRETTPEERASYGLEESDAKNISQGKVGTTVFGNILSTASKEAYKGFKDMGIREYDIQNSKKYGVDKDAPINQETAEKFIDSLIKEQGGKDSLDSWGGSVLKSAYSKYPDMRNTYSDQTHPEFVKRIASDLVQTLQNPTAKQPQGGMLSSTVGATTDSPLSLNETEKLKQEVRDKHMQYQNKVYVPTVNGLMNVKNQADLKQQGNNIEAVANTQLTRVSQAKYADKERLDRLKIPKASENETTMDIANAVLEKTEKWDKDKKAQYNQEAVLRSIDNVIGLVPAKYVQSLVEDSINSKGYFDPKIAELKAKDLKNTLASNKHEIDTIQDRLAVYVEVEEGLKSSLSAIKTLKDDNRVSLQTPLGTREWENSYRLHGASFIRNLERSRIVTEDQLNR